MEKEIIHTPQDAVPYVQKYGAYKREVFGIICLDGAHQVIKKKELFKGGYTSTLVDFRVLWYEAIKCRASAVILWHNHPSDRTEPSAEDITMTEKIKQGGEILGINVLDHLIIGKSNYYSFLENK